MGSWWSWFATIMVLWLFILSLLWASESRTKERDTSSHSRALSLLLSHRLDTQHANAETFRNTDTASQVPMKYTACLFLKNTSLPLYLDFTCTTMHFIFSTPFRWYCATFVLPSLQRLNICSPHEHYCIYFTEEVKWIHKWVSMTITCLCSLSQNGNITKCL